jgi:anaerobic ribonucleoside-triphosphate reductase activating protein
VTEPPSDEAAAGRPGPRELRVGGLVPFTAGDYPGHLAAVVFVQGCPWRCSYCHNPHLQPARGEAELAAAGVPAWRDMRPWLRRRAGLIDAVVFSGGEPTAEPALPQAMAEVRALGLRVGLHTAGTFPQRLQALLPRADWVGLDIKAPLADAATYERITGAAGAAAPVRRSLAAVLASGVAFECRTTAHPALLDDVALIALAAELAAAGVANWALQICRSVGTSAALAPVGADYPGPETLSRLQSMFATFTLRRA